MKIDMLSVSYHSKYTVLGDYELDVANWPWFLGIEVPKKLSKRNTACKYTISIVENVQFHYNLSLWIWLKLSK